MKKVAKFIFIIISLIILVSCSQSDNYNKKENTGIDLSSFSRDDIMDIGPEKGGVISLFSTFPDSLNPLISNNIYVQEYSSLIYDSMFVLDRSQKPAPSLVDRYKVSKDGLTWSFHLREDVFWHDNMQLTSEDIEFTIYTILDKKLKSIYAPNLKNVVTISIVDKYNFDIILSKPYSFFAQQLNFPILPKHYFIGENMLISLKNNIPMGTGPYRFVSNDGKAEIMLRSNDEWWKSKISTEKESKGKPYIFEIKIKLYKSVSDQIQAFSLKEVDVAFLDSADNDKYSNRTDISYKRFNSRNYDFISLNLNNAALSNKVVRTAIMQAIDREKIITESLKGIAEFSEFPVSYNSWINKEKTITSEKGKISSRELLIKDGWRDSNGIFYKMINGSYVPLSFELIVNNDSELRYKVATKISEQLDLSGIKLKVKRVEWDEYTRLINTRKFDLALMGTRITNVPDISFMYASNEILNGRNYSGYTNAEVDQLIDKLNNYEDYDSRVETFSQLKDIILSDVPYIGLYFINDAVIYNKRVRGSTDAFLWNKINDITGWYLPVK